MASSVDTNDRRTQVGRVRTMVRTQLAQSQRRRQQLSDALVALRQDLLKYRNEVRTRLREISQQAAARKAGSKVPPAPPFDERERVK